MYNINKNLRGLNDLEGIKIKFCDKKGIIVATKTT